jgi:hypothetical protein
VIIHNYKSGLIEVKHFFFLNWCGVPNETLKRFSLAILHNLVNSQTLQSASKTSVSQESEWCSKNRKKQRYELHFYILTAATTTIKLFILCKGVSHVAQCNHP